MTDPRAALPAVTTLLDDDAVAAAVAAHGHARTVAALRAALAEARAAVVTGDGDTADGDGEPAAPTSETVIAAALARLTDQDRRRLQPVINATGVLLHTNLGRAPLSGTAVQAIAGAAGPTNLELDLAQGERGGRGAVAHAALTRLTGADAALAVNNGAAALVLALTVLGHGREVVISRGELVEIGGSFRLPDIMASAGCHLREVGTTNRTRIDDYRAAIGPETGALLRVHPSNFRIDGFTARPTTSELSQLARQAGVAFIEDIGSGLLVRSKVARDEPVASQVVADGADLVIFSGDKLLGGPQAGILVGDAELVERCRRHPLARALRLDKLRMAALEATLASYERDALEELPAWALASVPVEELQSRAERLADRAAGIAAVATEAVLGGGSTPGNRLASVGLAVDGDAEQLAAALRRGDPPVVGRIVEDRLVLDLRSVPESQDEQLMAALAAAQGSAGARDATS